MSHGISAYVIDVNEADFSQTVIAQSHTLPIIVDFWAPWCGPCRTLGPILERLANEAAGAWVLAKVNVDNNQRISQQYGVQGIPAVKAFKAGSLCEQFTGAIPESQIRTWLKRIIPDATDAQLAHLNALVTQDIATARHHIASFISAHPNHQAGLLLYASVLVRLNDHTADDVLRQISTTGPLAASVHAWRTIAQGIQSSVVVADSPTATRFATAMHALQRGADAHAIELLIQIVASDRRWQDDQARKTLLALFTALGDTNPLVAPGRQQLAAVLF